LAVDFYATNGQPVYSLLLAGRSYEAIVEISPHSADNSEWHVLLNGDLYNVHVMDEREKRLQEMGGGGHSGSGGESGLSAPMPGLIATVNVQAGQTVEKGQILVVLEAMKMQNELKATKAGVVHTVRVKPGDSVQQNQLLVVIG